MIYLMIALLIFGTWEIFHKYGWETIKSYVANFFSKSEK